MKAGDLSQTEFSKLVTSTGLRYQTGPFNAKLRSQNPHLIETFQHIYSDLPILDNNTVCQYDIEIETERKKLAFSERKAQFYLDGIKPFEPYPYDHAFPMLEWGLNWCIGTSANQYLLLHSGVVEKNGLCLILPAMPGSGKSTLSSALALSGWRLLSDEFGVVQHSTSADDYCQVVPLPRAIPLKNESIDIIRNFSCNAVMGPIYPNTRKGTVCHLSPPGDSIKRQTETAIAKWIVFPHYAKGQKTQLIPYNKANAFIKVSNNSFNYQVTMEKGFKTLTKLIETTDCYSLPNGDLQEAVDTLNELAEHTANIEKPL